MENLFDLNSPSGVTWLVLGVIFVLIEVLAIPAMGFLFAGIGAITLGGLIIFNFIALEGVMYHIAYFFFFTTVWAIILWKPLKKSIKSSVEDSYQNIVGTTADATEKLEEGKVGYVKWSGTKMRARIAPDSTLKHIEKGKTVNVVGNKDGILQVDIKD